MGFLIHVRYCPTREPVSNLSTLSSTTSRIVRTYTPPPPSPHHLTTDIVWHVVLREYCFRIAVGGLPNEIESLATRDSHCCRVSSLNVFTGPFTDSTVGRLCFCSTGELELVTINRITSGFRDGYITGRFVKFEVEMRLWSRRTYIGSQSQSHRRDGSPEDEYNSDYQDCTDNWCDRSIATTKLHAILHFTVIFQKYRKYIICVVIWEVYNLSDHVFNLKHYNCEDNKHEL